MGDLEEADFCKTCSDHIRKGNVPNLAANYGFRYPEQHSCLSDLNDLEERLVALQNDESDIDDDDYDGPFVNPAPAETVINKLNTNIDAGLALTPGEDQMPLSVLFDDLVEELSYPRIYCGDMRRFTRKKPPTY
ncbi:hypothetical protein CDAR_424971 [Caerostris darwini]|uniref:Uncharacterized protein n=1 Tax=Caerostris darwini TaxID=1538125 RepID=A0AAV4RRR6_9ARAC|nr:hypothetical protein CDAR_424971 [Caerostris darwini]